jgi:hypothetical protein
MATNGKVRKVERPIYGSAQEARERPHANSKWRVFQITTPDGGALYTWAGDLVTAIYNVALAAGYKASSLEQAPSKDKLAASLAALSPEDRAALIALYVPAPAADKAPPKGKGAK